MRYRTIARYGAALAALAIASTGTVIVAPAAHASAMPAWNDWIAEQVDFIVSKQLDDGAILGVTRTGYTDINPYFANISALGLLAADTGTSRTAALKWMQWDLAHLNPAGPNVPEYSIFDYRYFPDSGEIVSVGDFDSVDSYASTTLNVAYAAYRTGDPALQQFVTDHITTYEGIADILDDEAPTGVRISSGDGAGLTIAKPSYPMPYTMDNAEVYSGLRDFADLERAMGRTEEADTYRLWADTTRTAIRAQLWNPADGNWDWAYLNSSDPAVFYAQGTAQVWPIVEGVVSPADSEAVGGWQQFSDAWPNWYDNGVPDAYPWISLAVASERMGQDDLAAAHLADAHARYAAGGFTLPTACGVASCGTWYVAEAGWFIRAAVALRDSATEPQTDEWRPDTAYTAPSTVSYEGRTYVAQWWTMGERPDASPWGAWAEIGRTTSCDTGDVTEWTASSIHLDGDTVVHDGRIWKAKWWTRNQEPGDPSGPWELSNVC